MSKRNEIVYTMAQDWIRWLDSRRLFGPPAHKSILEKMIYKTGSGREPDAQLSAELSAFNLAVSALELGHFVPFVAIYCDFRPEKKPVKALAGEIGISRDQFYQRAHAAADRVGSSTRQLMELSAQLGREIDGFVARPAV